MAKEKNSSKELKQFIDSRKLVAFTHESYDACTDYTFQTTILGYSNFTPVSRKIENKVKRLMGIPESHSLNVNDLVSSGVLRHIGTSNIK